MWTCAWIGISMHAWHSLEEFFRERLREKVFHDNSLMVAYAALRHLPWLDDMQRWLLTAVFSQIMSYFIPILAPEVSL